MTKPIDWTKMTKPIDWTNPITLRYIMATVRELVCRQDIPLDSVRVSADPYRVVTDWAEMLAVQVRMMAAAGHRSKVTCVVTYPASAWDYVKQWWAWKLQSWGRMQGARRPLRNMAGWLNLRVRRCSVDTEVTEEWTMCPHQRLEEGVREGDTMHIQQMQCLRWMEHGSEFSRKMLDTKARDAADMVLQEALVAAHTVPVGGMGGGMYPYRLLRAVHNYEEALKQAAG